MIEELETKTMTYIFDEMSSQSTNQTKDIDFPMDDLSTQRYGASNGKNQIAVNISNIDEFYKDRRKEKRENEDSHSDSSNPYQV